ncbi:MAG: thiosulfate ABC transporter substrate-binding protein CysP [Cardiobacteriaceae bacterium]|nr:thiosulfate ABC transporter substrate-binding protein CysP [Cardiobacteriaceae bacterium]
MKKLLLACACGLVMTTVFADQKLLNASYDISKALFTEYDELFTSHWAKTHNGEAINLTTTNAGSTKQAKTVAKNKLHKGRLFDVVTFNQSTDVELLVESGHIDADWQKRLQNQSSPYYSTIAFLVRKGNPKGIKSWEDLTKDGVSTVFPDPATSGNGRYTILGVVAYAKEKFPNDETKQDEFLKNFLNHVVLYETGGATARKTFAERKVGDVLLSFEAEVRSLADANPDEFEVVVPEVSVLADFYVAVVDKNVAEQATGEVAKAYLEYLYSKEAQELLAKHNYRVRNAEVAQNQKFGEVRLKSIKEIGGSWAEVKKTYFDEQGKFSQLRK